jgi:hypothetical protein
MFLMLCVALVAYLNLSRAAAETCLFWSMIAGAAIFIGGYSFVAFRERNRRRRLHETTSGAADRDRKLSTARPTDSQPSFSSSRVGAIRLPRRDNVTELSALFSSPDEP